MRELRDILSAFAALRRTGGRGVLACVVHAEGSTYRRPGTRALFLPDGRVVGLVSGGCVEGELAQQARSVLASGAPRRVHYDWRTEDDPVFGPGLGCPGRVDVLLERVGPEAAGPLDLLADCLAKRASRVLATLVRSEGPGALPLATRWLSREDGRFSQPLAEMGIARSVEAVARQVLATGRHGLARETERGRHTEVLLEAVRPCLRLLVCGAGPDAPPLVRIAAELGWEVVALDPRPAYAHAGRLPGVDRTICCHPQQAPERVAVDRDTAAVVMNHHYERDRALLAWLLRSRACYVGVLGPRARTEELLDDLHRSGVEPTEDQLERLYAPAGLDVGADAPEQIAVALVAEIQAVLAGRRGGLLRDRKGPIHERLA